MAGVAIQVSVTHTVIGTVLGSLVEAVIPRFTEGASASSLAFEALVQAGLTGAAVVLVAPRLAGAADPTHGIPFSAALLASQPEFSARIAKLGGLVKSQALSVAQKRPALVAGA